MPQGIKLLRHQKYAKMLCQSGKVASHLPTLIKKTAALCLIRYCCVLFGLIEPCGVCVQFFLKIKLSLMNTKPLRFRFGGDVCFILQLFF